VYNTLNGKKKVNIKSLLFTSLPFFFKD
jgi:hypothetical protein